MWKWIAIAAVVILVVPLLVTVIGAFLPKEHVATCRARFGASPETLFETLTDFPRWPEWNPAVKTMDRAPDRDGKTVWIATGSWGTMPTILEEIDPPHRLVTRIPEDAKLGFSGSWTYEIAAERQGAVLTITERGAVSSPIFRFMSAVFFDPHKTAEDFLRSLGKRFGESVVTERS